MKPFILMVCGVAAIACIAYAFYVAYGFVGLIPAAVILMALARD